MSKNAPPPASDDEIKAALALKKEEEEKARIKKEKRDKLYKIKMVAGFILLAASVALLLSDHYLSDKTLSKETMHSKDIMHLIIWLTCTSSVICIVPFYKIPYVIFDNEEQSPNTKVEELILKIRYRSILFNNLSVTIFFLIIIVIVVGFYLLVKPPVIDIDDTQASLTIRIGASVLLIFLVQILFRVFKYLLRVAAFYSGKADALEYTAMTEGATLKESIDLFTPEKYDISDLPQTSVTDSIADFLKGKPGQ